MKDLLTGEKGEKQARRKLRKFQSCEWLARIRPQIRKCGIVLLFDNADKDHSTIALQYSTLNSFFVPSAPVVQQIQMTLVSFVNAKPSS